MNIFKSASSDPNSLQNKLLGPSYSYSDNIRTPQQLGMSDEGSLKTLGNDVNGLLGYVSVLVDGSGKASVPGGPLGNKYFLQTGATCKDVTSKKEQTRYLYMNNVPYGMMPGLIKGVVSGMERSLNPFTIMGAFTSGTEPPCMPITMETIDANNNHGQETHYVTLTDINSMPAAFFPGGNKPNIPSTSEGFSSFQNYDDMEYSSVKMPDDIIIQLYFACLAGVGLYILYKLDKK